MLPKEHSFPEIGKAAAPPLKSEGAASFRPMFEGAACSPDRDETVVNNDKTQARNRAAATVQAAREEGILKGRQAATLDAHTQCAGELIELLETLLAAARRYQNRKKELLESSGQSILTLAETICQKVISHSFEEDTSQLEQFLERWVASGLKGYLPFWTADSDAFQVLLSAGEMLLPCEQATADRLQVCLNKLSSLADDEMQPDPGQPVVSIAELVQKILPKPEPS